MLFEYFKEFNKRVVKKSAVKKAPSQKATAKKGTSKKAASKKSTAKTSSVKLDIKNLRESLSRIIPLDLEVSDANPLDANGFSPDGADLCIYKPFCRDIVEIMGGCIPQELLKGTVFSVDVLNKKTLQDALNRVAAVKKINRLSTEGEEDESFNIPSFIIAGAGDYSMLDLKNDILNGYMNNNVDERLKFEILVILDKGLVIRDWHKKTYVSLETSEDTMVYFFILLNEYLEAERDSSLDFRKYVKTDRSYNEY